MKCILWLAIVFTQVILNLTGGVDYGSKSVSFIPVVFSAGVASISFDVPIIDDNILEQSETFNVSIDPISLPYGVTLGSTESAVVTILDDDSKHS